MTIEIAKNTSNTKSRVTFADYLNYFDGSDTRNVDYRAKRTEYAARDIPEY